MARVALIAPEQAPLKVRAHFGAGDPGALTASVAQVPELLAALSPFLRAVYGPSALPIRLKEIVVLRVSAMVGCRYCTQTHSAIALGAGLARDELVALLRPAADAAFTDPREVMLIRWADALAAIPDPVPAALADEMAGLFSDHEIVEITMVGGATLMLNRYATALDLPASQATLDKLAAEGLL